MLTESGEAAVQNLVTLHPGNKTMDLQSSLVSDQRVGIIDPLDADRASNSWHKVKFDVPFSQDKKVVIFPKTQTYIGPATPNLRIQNVTHLGFEIRFDEVIGDTSLADGSHAPEVVGWIAYGFYPVSKLLGVGTDNQLYTRDTLTSNWVKVPNSGAVTDAIVMPDGKILGIGMNNELYTRDTLTSNWVNVPNSGAVTGVTIMPDGTIVGIGMNKDLYTRATLTSNWVNVPNSGSVISVAAGKGLI